MSAPRLGIAEQRLRNFQRGYAGTGQVIVLQDRPDGQGSLTTLDDFIADNTDGFDPDQVAEIHASVAAKGFYDGDEGAGGSWRITDAKVLLIIFAGLIGVLVFDAVAYGSVGALGWWVLR